MPLFVVVVAVGSIGSVAAVRILRPLPSATIRLSVTDSPGEAVSLNWPESGQAAIAAESGALLASSPGSGSVVPTASIAKLITMLTVLQKYPLKAGEQGPVVTLGDADVALRNRYAAINGSTVAVEAGEQISQYQMIEAMALPSANNIADSLAVWAFGSLDAYRVAAQQYVTAKGLADTSVGTDASGYDASTTSTVSDLVRLGQLAYAQPVIREIVGKQTATIPVAGEIGTTNPILGQNGINGLKTGTSEQAGNCYLFSAQRTFGDGVARSFIGVIIDAPSDRARFSEAADLLDQAAANVVTRTVVVKGRSVGTVTTAWGAVSPVVPTADVSVTRWRGEAVAVRAKAAAAPSDVAAGQAVGTVTAASQSARLVVRNALPAPTLWWRLTHE